MQICDIASLEGNSTVADQQNEEKSELTTSNNLYLLASSNAHWLMELADVKRFAVDDCITLTNSRDFAGWEPHEIKTSVLHIPVPIPDDLEELRQTKISIIGKDYYNSSQYKLLYCTSSISDLDRLEVTLVSLGFHEYYSLTPFLDEPLLTALDGSKVSIRQKYGNTIFTYSATDSGNCLIPAPVSLQCLIVTKDDQILLTRRSSSVAYYPNHWSSSFEETMNAPGLDRKGISSRSHDTDFFAGAYRGLHEEFAISPDAVDSVKVLSLNVEYLTLSVDVIMVIKTNLTFDEIQGNWMLKVWNRDEAANFALLSTDLHAIVEKLFSRTLWHPTSRMRLIQYLFHTYGIDEVEKAIKKRQG
jgi:hypothetical protein